MKYIGVLLGLFLVSTYVWAEEEAPATNGEQMNMYVTLSAPIASFWEVNTTSSTNAVVMPLNSTLNLGVKYGEGKGSAGGKITSPTFQIDTLSMQDGTKLVVGDNNNSVKWMLPGLVLGAVGDEAKTATFNGDLLVDELSSPGMTSGSIRVEVDGILTLGNGFAENTISLDNAEFSDIELQKGTENNRFVFEDENLPPGTVTSSVGSGRRLIYTKD